MLYPNRTFAGCPTTPNQQYFGDVAMHIAEIFPAFNNARVQGNFIIISILHIHIFKNLICIFS